MKRKDKHAKIIAGSALQSEDMGAERLHIFKDNNFGDNDDWVIIT